MGKREVEEGGKEEGEKGVEFLDWGGGGEEGGGRRRIERGEEGRERGGARGSVNKLAGKEEER